MIDVSNDHLCYVVTDRKTPWHLPYSQDFQLVSKIVITHIVKSKCRLAIYIKVEWASWAKPARIAKGILRLCALDESADLEKVSLLDVRSRTSSWMLWTSQMSSLTKWESLELKAGPKRPSRYSGWLGSRPKFLNSQAAFYH